MDVRILDLDAGLPRQTELVTSQRPAIVPFRQWGPSIRMGCGFGRFRRFERDLAVTLGSTHDDRPQLTLYGSGDFHHVSLAFLRRQVRPFNLLVLDNHPDWMRGVPFLHCGTWLYHAARLPQLRRIFHVGGEVDFDNYYRWLAPWNFLRAGKITVFPAVRRFQRGPWATISNQPLRKEANSLLSAERLHDLIHPYRAELTQYPLYISLDKDVLIEAEAVVNWDSGRLRLPEALTILEGFIDAARGNLAGADILGDWSPVQVQGWLRRGLHFTEHPTLVVDAAEASRRNAGTNLALMRVIGQRQCSIRASAG